MTKSKLVWNCWDCDHHFKAVPVPKTYYPTCPECGHTGTRKSHSSALKEQLNPRKKTWKDTEGLTAYEIKCAEEFVDPNCPWVEVEDEE